MNENEITIDPPSGWKYGFPKSVSKEEFNKIKSLTQWCIDNGYPENEVKSYGEHFYIKVNNHPKINQNE